MIIFSPHMRSALSKIAMERRSGESCCYSTRAPTARTGKTEGGESRVRSGCFGKGINNQIP